MANREGRSVSWKMRETKRSVPCGTGSIIRILPVMEEGTDKNDSPQLRGFFYIVLFFIAPVPVIVLSSQDIKIVFPEFVNKADTEAAHISSPE